MTTTPENATSMWDDYVEPGEELSILFDVGPFVLLRASVRTGIKTEYGLRDAVDLVVQTTEAEKWRTFSGFPAGIVAQAKRQGAGDFPALCRIGERPTPKGTTRELVLESRLEPGAEPKSLAAIAAGLPTPIQPIAAGDVDDDIPY